LDPATAGIQSSFSNEFGTWSVDASGDVTYTPDLNYNGTASVTYRVNDNNGLTSNTATITVTVNPVNDAPVAVDDDTSTNEDAPVTFNVTSNDTDGDGSINAATVDLDPATAGIQNSFSNEFGTWSVDASGDVTYTPDLNYNGTASVTYTISDNNGLTSAPATISVEVTPVNDAPIAVADIAVVDEDNSVSIDVASNDTDVDGSIDAASIDLDPVTNGLQHQITTPEGEWSVSEAGVLTFVPVADLFGTASVSYTVSDNDGLTSAPCTITITITP